MKSILIVEPSDVVRGELEAALQKDYRICACASGEEAEDLFMCCQPDGLLINLRLPGMDGLYFLEQHEQYLPPVIITLAASYSPPLEQRLVDLGVHLRCVVAGQRLFHQEDRHRRWSLER